MKFLVIYLHVVFEFGVVCESVPFLISVSFFPYISREVFHVAVRLFLFISANLHLVGLSDSLLAENQFPSLQNVSLALCMLSLGDSPGMTAVVSSA